MELPALEAGGFASLVQRLYGFRVASQRKLNSTDDINVHVLADAKSDNPAVPTVSADGYVLKILNSVDSKKVSFVDAMHGAIECSIKHGIATPTPVRNVNGQLFSLESFPTRQNGVAKFLVRLFLYLPGEILFDKPCTPVTSYQLGQMAAKLDKALMTFDHPSLSGHKRHWSLTEVVNLEEKLGSIDNEKDRELVRDIVKSFRENVVENYSRLQKGVIHGDLNCENLLVKRLNDNDCDDFFISGVLDFGDLVREYHVFEIAITIMYLMTDTAPGDPIETSGHLLAGYLANFRLPAFDLSVLKECVCGRLAQSLVYGAQAVRLDLADKSPERIQRKWALLRTMWNTPKNELYFKWNCILREYGLKLEINSQAEKLQRLSDLQIGI